MAGYAVNGQGPYAAPMADRPYAGNPAQPHAGLDPVRSFEAHPQMTSDSGLPPPDQQAMHRPLSPGAEEGEDLTTADVPIEFIPLPLRVSSRDVKDLIVEFFENPRNLFVTFWLILSILVTVFYVLFDAGVFNSVIKRQHRRKVILNIFLQILDSLFVLMCIIWHPFFFYQAFGLLRFSKKDRVRLRHDYNRGSQPKPRERFHIAVIVFFLHVTCFATYAFAAIYYAYPYNHHPAAAVAITTVASFGAPIVAFLYHVLSPLSRDYETVYPEGQPHLLPADAAYERSIAINLDPERQREFIRTHAPVENPHWAGSVIPGCCNDVKTACATTVLPFCVFGYSAERLGLGERFVQALTLFVVIAAPIVVFVLSALTVANKRVGVRLGIICGGVVMSYLGLLYGACLRCSMRRKYHLPAQRWCLGSACLTDAMYWLICPSCAICQEARTAKQYSVAGGKCYEKTDVEMGLLNNRASSRVTDRVVSGGHMANSGGMRALYGQM